jgi:hypothetical protein
MEASRTFATRCTDAMYKGSVRSRQQEKITVAKHMRRDVKVVHQMFSRMYDAVYSTTLPCADVGWLNHFIFVFDTDRMATTNAV